MKVLFVSSGNQRGLSIICKAQADDLRSIGIEVQSFLIEGRGILGYTKNIFSLKKYLKINKLDLIHAHYGLSGIVALCAKGKEKLVVSFMGDDILGSNTNSGKIKIISRIIAKINIFLANIFYDFVIVKSKEMRKKIRTNKVEIVPNGVNLLKFPVLDKSSAREKLAIKSDSKLIIFVADPKRHEKNYKLAEQAVKLSKINNLEFRTIYKTTHSELYLYYNAADIVLMTSFHEGSPNVIKEAMACNCSIVTTNVGDISWVIGSTPGCFITKFNVQDVLAQILFALNFVKENGRTYGRDRIIELGLDSVAVAKRINEIYHRISE
ncbi:MAG: glycosyltransferase family 4 protein [Ignavibacteria bacterium]